MSKRIRFLKGYRLALATGHISTKFNLFNKTGEFEEDAVRPRLIWNPSHTLLATAGLLNRVAIRVLRRIEGVCVA